MNYKLSVMSILTAVNKVIKMVKPNPFQQNPFDLKYIEDQVSAIKKSVNKTESVEEVEEKNLMGVMEEQLAILQNIEYLLAEINNNTKKKKSWLNFKD